MELGDMEIACLMRVLSKQELQHSILLQDLLTVMENFGILETIPPPTQEEKTEKKNVKNKEKKLREFIQKDD